MSHFFRQIILTCNHKFLPSTKKEPCIEKRGWRVKKRRACSFFKNVSVTATISTGMGIEKQGLKTPMSLR